MKIYSKETNPIVLPSDHQHFGNYRISISILFVSKIKLHYFFENKCTTNPSQTHSFEMNHHFIPFFLISYRSWEIYQTLSQIYQTWRFQNIKKKGHKLSSTFSKCRKIYFQIQYFSITNMISLQTLLHLFKQTNKIKITYSSLQPSDSKKSRKHPNVYSQHILYGVALQLQLQRHNLYQRKSSWKFLQRPPKIVLIKTLFYILLINKYKLSNNQ